MKFIFWCNCLMTAKFVFTTCMVQIAMVKFSISHLCTCFWEFYSQFFPQLSGGNPRVSRDFQCRSACCEEGCWNVSVCSCPLQIAVCLYVEVLICPLSFKVVLVTDGCLGIGRGSLRHSLATHNQRSESNRFPLPFPFPSKLYVMCMANLEEVMSLTHTFFFVALDNYWASLN